MVVMCGCAAVWKNCIIVSTGLNVNSGLFMSLNFLDGEEVEGQIQLRDPVSFILLFKFAVA